MRHPIFWFILSLGLVIPSARAIDSNPQPGILAGQLINEARRHKGRSRNGLGPRGSRPRTARTTAENAARSLPLLLGRGVREVTVVCAPLHIVRVRYFFSDLYRRFGVEADVRAADCPLTPLALARELGALGIMWGQRRAALAELEAAR